MNLNPSNFGANLSAEDDLCDSGFPISLPATASSRENWIFELEKKPEEEGAEIAVAEAAATDAAKNPDFFIVEGEISDLRKILNFPGKIFLGWN